MMKHNDFAAMLLRINSVQFGDIPKFLTDVITKTNQGVYPAGVVTVDNPIIISVDEYNRLLAIARGGTTQVTDSKAETVHALANNGERISGFKFGPASEKELVGVDPRLVRCARLALQVSLVDFCVHDGIRTVKEQQTHVKNGTSKTMKSKHLDGLALDLVPWINGKPVWDWEGCYQIAHAMDLAATQLGIADKITWGGAWDRRLSDFGGDLNSYRREVELYRSRHPGPDFIDGPHFEIAK